MRRRAAVASVAAHAVVLAILGWFAPRDEPRGRGAVEVEDSDIRLVWIPAAGPSGGGGGGGNRQPRSRPAQVAGHERLNRPQIAGARAALSTMDVQPVPVVSVDIPAIALGAALESLPGALERIPDFSPTALGGGSGNRGAGDGSNGGVGPGDGDGLGPGDGHNTGTGPYGVGNDVTAPRVIYAAKPHYTADAMRSHVQGSVLVGCVVQTNGRCRDPRVLRSLDPRWGLDAEALATALEWRFAPGTRRGEPVAVYVTIELAFMIH